MGSLYKAFALAIIMSVGTPVASVAESAKALILPQIPVKGCRGGRAKLYDECGSQKDLFETALARAEELDRTLLVSYGAEWCIWCHVFDAYVTGQHSVFTHQYSDPQDQERFAATIFERASRDPSVEAVKLEKFFADRFVLVHIDDRYAKDGHAVLETTGAIHEFNGGLPFVFSVDAGGAFAGAMVSKRVETRRDTVDWFRGYDRRKLKKELERLRKLASR